MRAKPDGIVAWLMGGVLENAMMDGADRDTIRIEDSTLRKGFTRIPNGILRREGLSPGAKLTYMGLLSYAWQAGSCFPGQARLAQDLGIGQRSVIRYLKELKTTGLLRIRRRGLGKTNIYILPRDESADQDDGRVSYRQRAQHPTSARMAHQEAPEEDEQEVPDWQREEDEGKEDSDHSNLRTVAPQRKQGGGVEHSCTTPTANGSNQFEAVGSYLKGRAASRPSKSETAASDREIVSAYMEDIARELRDTAPLRSTVTRLLNLYERSKLDNILSFPAVLLEARRITATYTREIRKGDPGAREMIPYFISVVVDLLGLKDNAKKSSRSSRSS